MYTCNVDHEGSLAQVGRTYNLVIGSVDLGGLRSPQFVMRHRVDPQNRLLLECPSGHVSGNLSVSRVLSTERGVS